MKPFYITWIGLLLWGFCLAEGAEVMTQPELILGTGALYDAAFSPDGRYIATAGTAGVFLWDVKTGEVQRRYLGHTARVMDVAFSADGAYIASGGWDKTVRVWDTATCEPVMVYPTTDRIAAVAMSPDNQQIVAVCGDQKIHQIRFPIGEPIRIIEGYGDSSSKALFFNHGRWFLTGGGAMRLWDAATGELLTYWVGFRGHFASIAIPPDETMVLGGLDFSAAKAWNLFTGEMVIDLDYLGGFVRAVDFSPDGRMFLTGVEKQAAYGGNPAGVVLWDTKTQKEIRRFAANESGIYAAEFSPDGRTVMALVNQSHIRLHDVESGDLIRKFEGEQSISDAAFSPDGRWVATGHGDSQVILWDADTGHTVWKYTSNGPVNSLDYSPDGKAILLGTEACCLTEIDAGTGQEINNLRDFYYAFYAVAYSPDGRYWLASNGESFMQATHAVLYDRETKEIVRLFGDVGTNRICFVTFSPDYDWILTVGRFTMYTGETDEYGPISRDFGGFKKWDWHDGRLDTVYPITSTDWTSYPPWVYAAVYSPESDMIATAGDDGVACLWKYNVLHMIQQYRGHAAGVLCVAFSPDSRWLATGSDDKTAKIWNRETGEELFTLTGHAAGVTAVQFSPDGRRLLTASRDGTARIWDVSALTSVPAWTLHE